MKRFAIIVAVVAALVAFSLLMSAEDESEAGSLYSVNGQYTLLSNVTTTDAGVTGSSVPMRDPYVDFTVDVITAGTGTVVVRVDGTGYNDGTFDSSGLGTAITCSNSKCTAIYISQPMMALRGVITESTGTNVTSVRVLGVGR